MSGAIGNHRVQLVAGSLAATSFVGFTQIVSRGGELSQSLHAAIFFFALSIPLLVAVAISDMDTPERIARARRATLVVVLIFTAPVLGICCMFANYGWGYLNAFAISFLLAVALEWWISGRDPKKSGEAAVAPPNADSQ